MGREVMSVKPPTDYHVQGISTLTGELIEFLGNANADPAIKMAALRSAADMIQNAVVTQAMVAKMYETLVTK
jgi:hypothetical protein